LIVESLISIKRADTRGAVARAARAKEIDPMNAIHARAAGASPPSLSIAIAGSGGSGVMTAGAMLLDAAARSGR
jgi:hypothetical protein